MVDQLLLDVEFRKDPNEKYLVPYAHRFDAANAGFIRTIWAENINEATASAKSALEKGWQNFTNLKQLSRGLAWEQDT